MVQPRKLNLRRLKRRFDIGMEWGTRKVQIYAQIVTCVGWISREYNKTSLTESAEFCTRNFEFDGYFY